MNIISLKYFLALASYSSFTKASEKLFISQPTLSRHIAELEEALGTPLFDRGKKAVTLTEEGRQCLEQIREIVRKYEELTTDIKLRRENGFQGNLTIGLPGTIQFDAIVEPLQTFIAQNPRVKVKFTRGRFSELYRQLVLNEVDCIYTFTTDDTLPLEGIKFETLDTSPLKVLASSAHPLAGLPSVSPRELDGETFIFFDRPDSPIHLDIETEFFIRNNISPKNIITASDPQTVAMMVSLQMGITLPFAYSMTEIPQYTTTIDIRDNLWDPNICLSLGFNKKSQNPLPYRFYKTVKEYCTRRQGGITDRATEH